MAKDSKDKEDRIFSSIYKIDKDEAKIICKLNDTVTVEEIRDKILSNIQIYVEKQNENNYVELSETEDFSVLLIKTTHTPVWKKIILNQALKSDLVDEDYLFEKFDFNINLSYIILYIYDTELYAMTGGYGSNYIKKIIEKNYGLYLLPKIVGKNDTIIKKLQENYLYGARATALRVNRNATSISGEQDLSSIYNELSVGLDNDLCRKIGLPVDDDRKNNINIVNKDSLVIRKSLTLEDIKTVISKLNILEKQESKFALNYLLPVKDIRMKNKNLFDFLYASFVERKFSNFDIFTPDFEKYYFGVSEYIVEDIGGNEIHRTDEPINLLHIFNLIPEDKKLSISYMKNIMKWSVHTIDENGNISLAKTKVSELIQGFIEYKDKKIYYLIAGKWFVFDDTYKKFIIDEYKSIYNNSITQSNSLKNQFSLKQQADNEDIYNKLFFNNKFNGVIYANQTFINWVEIADLIFYDNINLYLMCNKDSCNGSSIRDVANQILTSSEIINRKMQESTGFLKDYYKRLCEKCTGKKLLIDETSFVKLFTDKQIVYICGYLEGLKENTESTYIQFLVYDLSKKLQSKGYKLILMDILG